MHDRTFFITFVDRVSRVSSYSELSLVRRSRFPLRTRFVSEEFRTGALWPLCRPVQSRFQACTGRPAPNTAPSNLAWIEPNTLYVWLIRLCAAQCSLCGIHGRTGTGKRVPRDQGFSTSHALSFPHPVTARLKAKA
ncbi:unnamed protein product [Leptosia nina]|uniref:Uncharacterized protein n=1 Tax=Leptosia nina TaxID=320188 RepID=A0AAV1JKA3_9NEOP